MADITLAMPFLLLNEDGKDQKWFYQSQIEAIKGEDPGGETVHGIARKFWGSWAGWKIVDSFKGVTGFPQILLNNATLDALVSTFYKTNFWDKILGDQINAQVIATQVFDSAVNQGVGAASGLIQNAINWVENCVAVDGDLGPKTLSALNRLCFTAGNSGKILDRFLELRRARYQARAAQLQSEGSVEANDLPVWLARCVIPVVA